MTAYAIVGGTGTVGQHVVTGLLDVGRLRAGAGQPAVGGQIGFQAWLNRSH